MTDWFDTVLAEAVRVLAEQRAALDSIRTRGAALVAAGAAVTGFMVNAALVGHTGLPGTATAALVAFAACALSGILANLPRTLTFGGDADDLLGEGWMKHDESDRRGYLVKNLSSHARANRKRLRALHRWLATGYAALTLSVLFWTLTLIGGRT